MNNIKNKTIGITGENLAVKYLQENGYTILERNYRYKHFEIDIIAKINNCLHFIEVKYRKTNKFGYPEDFVTENQKERIKQAATEYIYNTRWENKISFDTLSIENQQYTNKITLFTDSF